MRVCLSVRQLTLPASSPSSSSPSLVFRPAWRALQPSTWDFTGVVAKVLPVLSVVSASIAAARAIKAWQAGSVERYNLAAAAVALLFLSPVYVTVVDPVFAKIVATGAVRGQVAQWVALVSAVTQVSLGAVGTLGEACYCMRDWALASLSPRQCVVLCCPRALACSTSWVHPRPKHRKQKARRSSNDDDVLPPPAMVCHASPSPLRSGVAVGAAMPQRHERVSRRGASLILNRY